MLPAAGRHLKHHQVSTYTSLAYHTVAYDCDLDFGLSISSLVYSVLSTFRCSRYHPFELSELPMYIYLLGGRGYLLGVSALKGFCILEFWLPFSTRESRETELASCWEGMYATKGIAVAFKSNNRSDTDA